MNKEWFEIEQDGVRFSIMSRRLRDVKIYCTKMGLGPVKIFGKLAFRVGENIGQESILNFCGDGYLLSEKIITPDLKRIWKDVK